MGSLYSRRRRVVVVVVVRCKCLWIKCVSKLDRIFNYRSEAHCYCHYDWHKYHSIQCVHLLWYQVFNNWVCHFISLSLYTMQYLNVLKNVVRKLPCYLRLNFSRHR
jgi:hypothetical protein